MPSVTAALLCIGLLHPTLHSHEASLDDDTVPEAARPAEVQPGSVGLLTSGKGMKYFLRVPKTYQAKRGARVIVFMHGSNMNGLSYLRSFEAKKWAEDAILVCPNGETGNQPYGANNFTQQSAPFIAELTETVLKDFKATRVYIGGHSQGGFLTYSVIMLYPDLYHGAIPMAGDCWMQNEPNLWEDKPNVVAKQKKIAIAVIHGQADPVVAFSQGEHAHGVFLAMGYPKLRFFKPERLGHQFMLSPVAEALDWLDAVTGLAPAKGLKLSEKWAQDREWGWVIQTCQAAIASEFKTKATSKQAKSILKKVEKPAKAATKEMALRMEKTPAREWLPHFWEFRQRFGATRAARAVIGHYDKQRADQRQLGSRLFNQARSQGRGGDQAASQATLQKLLAEAPCSFHAWYALSWLD